MSLKDEIEKLVKKRRRELAQGDKATEKATENASAIAKAKLAEIQPMLDELEQSMDYQSVFVVAEELFAEIDVNIYVGAKSDRDAHESDQHWKLLIYPYDKSWQLKTYIGASITDVNSFPSPKSLFAYLVPEIAEEIVRQERQKT